MSSSARVRHVSERAIRTDLWSKRNAIRPVGRMTEHTLSTARASSAAVGIVTESGAALAQRDPGPRHLGVKYAMRVSPNVFGLPTILSSMMVKLIPTYG
jgi:hypothetical protein